MSTINITLSNQDNTDLQVDWGDCKVKTKGGFYKTVSKTQNTENIVPGGTSTIVYNADFGTNVKRRYKINITDGENDQVIFFPSRNGWTDNPELTIPIRVR